MLCACSGCEVNSIGGAGSASPSSEKGVRFGASGFIEWIPAKSLDETRLGWFHEIANIWQEDIGSGAEATLAAYLEYESGLSLLGCQFSASIELGRFVGVVKARAGLSHSKGAYFTSQVSPPRSSLFRSPA